uniref:PREDICTED: similar to SWI/SNFrelated matrixassociated actindependent regulator of chromatin a2 isoform b isoform 10 putative n=1 Tax=Albugo laibachii Nc14 TaxID=890382 RepID=F0WFJ0_9STRA|nr:PREDICTED: similar to SWI/SNFrelated matrixassociated actindependent regulator of chromatin a2 isoform b isoform 10 putative [Albugo laibachii Nc14]|eukprot:CCA19972.1 PREDICTED: similar to SWI/SNFrelated matrixassociated actindependent regulator of chromatin a2 isoform b isoform 10 putative [Albugo laibachii Nc14]
MEGRKAITSADVKRLMDMALHMQRENQTNHPKYAQIVALLRQYHQQQQQTSAAPSTLSLSSAASTLRNNVTSLIKENPVMETNPVLSSIPLPNVSIPSSSTLPSNATKAIKQESKEVKRLMGRIAPDMSSLNPSPQLSALEAQCFPIYSRHTSSISSLQNTPLNPEYLQKTVMGSNLVTIDPLQHLNSSSTLCKSTSGPKKLRSIPGASWRNLLRQWHLRRNNQSTFIRSRPLFSSELEEYTRKTFEALDPNKDQFLRCTLIQRKLRQQMTQLHLNRLDQVGIPSVSIYNNRFLRSFRAKHHKKSVLDEYNETEGSEFGAQSTSNLRRKQRHAQYQDYMTAIVNHTRNFYSFHKQVKVQLYKCARHAKVYVEQRISKAEREEDRQERLRLKALKANDMEAYIKLVAEAKNERLSYLLSQTNQYLDSIRELVHQHKEKCHLADQMALETSRNDDSEINYIEIACKSELPRQPMMLVGGDLKEYQLRGLQWMVSLYDNHLNGILADEMGLGKTIQTIALLTYITEIRHNHGPFLVVVPLSTLSNWVIEFKKWAPKLSIVVYKGPPCVRKELFRQEMASCQFNVLLTTYEYTMKDKHVLRKYEWQYIIVDEGHRMKNAQSKFAMTLGTMYRSRNRLLLTGTPLQNSLPELWALLNFLLPTIFESVDTFEQWFSKPFSQFSGTGNDTQNDLSDEERMLIINRLHQVLRPFLLRRVKASVLDQLPEKVERVLKCELSGWQKILYRRIQQGGAILLEQEGNEKSSKAKYTFKGLSNVLMQLRKVCNHPYLFQPQGYPIDFDLVRSSGKFELLDRMLPKLKAAGHRVLMFSQMTQLMHILEDYFQYRSFTYLRLDGSTSADEREQRMFMFNASDSPHFIFLLSTRAGGLGLNLATADTVIIFDSDWNPAMDAQAQDRAHRIGQKNEVRVFRLVTNSPVEEKILSRATNKLNMNNLVVEAGKFNNRSKEAERRAMLESLIKMEAEEAATNANGDGNSVEEGISVLEDDEINELMALTEEELALYQRMDHDRNRVDKEWMEIHRRGSSLPQRLMNEDEVPEWLKDANQQLESQQELARSKGDWRWVVGEQQVGRKRKEIVSYRESLTESEFIKICENGVPTPMDRMEDVKKPKSNAVKSVRPSCFAPPDQMSKEAQKTRKTFCYFYRKVHDGVLKLADARGHPRSALFMAKPSPIEYPDYYQIIKYPMSLGMIKERIDGHLYSDHAMFADDFRVMIENAQVYNPPKSLVVEDALAIDRYVQRQLRQIEAKAFSDLNQEYQVARQQHRQRSRARKEKKRAKLEEQ